ncbi:hypothetical protein AX15_003692 [Amanita polypyramis BW_CC]|nr:hypothetical protein AX15_003692 [Amanita polypyramis BW_CC]
MIHRLPLLVTLALRNVHSPTTLKQTTSQNAGRSIIMMYITLVLCGRNQLNHNLVCLFQNHSPAHTPSHDFNVKQADSGALSLIDVGSTSQCGPTGATAQTETTSGPNGHIQWLNCGIDTNGWNPPPVRVENLVTQDLRSALSDPNTPFKSCSTYIDLFEKYGREFKVPSILLASFAMQESSCNRNAVGGGGEQGIMQISKDKCGGAPGGDCKNPEFNIRTAAKFFSGLLKANGGNVLLSIGSYNGWFRGMTHAQATAAANSGCCRCQQNLDYIHQFVNGWLQNIDAHDRSPPLGKYFNLNICL